MNLGRRIVRGSLSLSAGSWSAQLVNLLIQVGIARLLGPAEFGLYAFCFAINEFLTIVGAFSLDNALVQAREESQTRYDTAFAVCAGLGLVVVLLALAIAPVLWTQRSSRAAWILVTMAVATLARLLSQPPFACLERSLRYGTVTLILLAVGVLPNLLALLLAYLGLGAWSLAIRDVVVTVSLLALMLWASGYRFRGQVERGAFRELMDFSRPMFVSRSLETLMERMDSLAVGLFFGNRATGIYHWGRLLAEGGFVATRPLERISMNLYARLQDDRARLSRAFSLVNTVLVRVMLAGAAVLLVFPAETVHLLLGEEWGEVAPLLRWFGLYAGLYPLFHNLKVLYYGVGQVRSMVRLRVVQALLFAGSVLTASLLGSLHGVAAALLGTSLVSLALAWHWGRDLVDVRAAALLAVPAAVLAATVALLLGLAGPLAALPWFVKPFLPPLVFAAGVFALERRKLVADLRFLLAQARGGAPEAPR